MPEETQNDETLGKEEAAPTIHDTVMAELAKLKEDANYVPALPKGIVLDAEMPDGYYMTRPCLEEFVASGYKAELYDSWFTETLAKDSISAWGPGWSDPNWTRAKGELIESLPPVLAVRSQVRRTNTRTARARAPSRHRFKQFLFGDPSYRLVRNGERQVSSDKVLANLNELIDKETQGILSVHFLDGRRLNLELLKNGLVEASVPSLPAPLPNPPLDSIANDDPSGNPMPTFIDGSYPGDPAAAATLEQMLKDKAAEQGELPGDTTSDEFGAVVDTALETMKEQLLGEQQLGVSGSHQGGSNVSDPLADVTDNEMPREDVVEDNTSAEPAEAVEAPATHETPVPETVPDVKTANKPGKKGNKR